MAVKYSLPALLRDIKSQIDTPATGENLLKRAWEFRQRLLRIGPELQAIMSDSTLVREEPSHDMDSPFLTCYRYSNHATAQAVVMYWRLLVTINETIRGLEHRVGTPLTREYPTDDIEASSLQSADCIFRSAETIRQWKPLSSMFLLYSLPVAYCVYPEDSLLKRLWISELVHENLKFADAAFKTIVTAFLKATGMQSSLERSLQALCIA